MHKLVIALAAAGIAGSAAAQGIYRYTASNGSVVYTDKPPAGSAAQRISMPPLMTTPAPRLGEAERRLVRQSDQRAEALDQAVEDVASATTALREAETHRSDGIEPLEGERQGRRMRPEYWERQRALELAVVSARARLDEASERRNSLR